MNEDESHTWDWRPRDHATTTGGDNPSREWALIEKLVLAQTREQRRRRRWGIFFRLAILVYLFLLLFGVFAVDRWAWQGSDAVSAPHLAVVSLEGTIGTDLPVSYEQFRQPLMEAFANPEARAVVLEINSTGGSPVQSQRLFGLIQRLKEASPDRPVYALVGDVAASGGYYLAVAADEIIVSPASLVGSIGVVSGGFGLDEALRELGVERRLYTAGENKAFLDMFSPEDEEAVAHWQSVLDSVYEQFVTDVRESRGARLDTSNPDVLSGYLWSGEQAVANGLADSSGSMDSLLVQHEVDELVYHTPSRHPWQEVLDDLAPGIGAGIVKALSHLGADGLPGYSTGNP